MTLPTRTLKDYRPQHDHGCAYWVCGVCGKNSTDCYYFQEHPKRESDRIKKHAYVTQSCSCGLDHLLAEFDAPGAQENGVTTAPNPRGADTGKGLPPAPEVQPSYQCEDRLGIDGKTYRCDSVEGHEGSHSHGPTIRWQTPAPGAQERNREPGTGNHQGAQNGPSQAQATEESTGRLSHVQAAQSQRRQKEASHQGWTEGQSGLARSATAGATVTGAQERTTEDQDHGAGLIHQAIPDMAGTEPRLNKSEK